MKRIFIGTLVSLAFWAHSQFAQADNIQLTLDLRNGYRSHLPSSGGTWDLYARVVHTDNGADGSEGLAGIRALLDNVNLDGITFNPAINPNGTATAQFIPGDAEGTLEVIYQQDLAQPTVSGIGIPPTTAPNKDVLIASGTWPAGPRIRFGSDGANFSAGEFLAGDGTSSVAADSVATSVVTLGDFNNSNAISNADISLYTNCVLTCSLGITPYNPAGDINQSGAVTNADTVGFVILLLSPVTATVAAVPEPSTFGFMGMAAIGLLRRTNWRSSIRR